MNGKQMREIKDCYIKKQRPNPVQCGDFGIHREFKCVEITIKKGIILNKYLQEEIFLHINKDTLLYDGSVEYYGTFISRVKDERELD